MPATKQAYENKCLKISAGRLEYLDTLLDGYLKEDYRQFFIVRAHRFGVPIYEYCGGTSTKEYGIKQDTISCVFSITKPMTSTLIMKLLEDGLLDITDPVSNYLDCFKSGGKDGIMLWQLMTHSSGIIDEDNDNFKNQYIEKLGLTRPDDDASDEIHEEFNRQLKIKLGLDENAPYSDIHEYIFSKFTPTKYPGEIMAYSNTGYYYLGKVIEKVSGMTISDYGRKVLFEPLGMVDSFYSLPEDRFHRVVGRNERCIEHEWLNTEDHYKWPGAMGGVKTTVIDLCRFGDMLLNKGTLDGVRVLSPASIREMSVNHNLNIANPAAWDSWGLGFNLRGTKKDDAGVLRSEFSLEHGGMCGHKFLADPEYGVVISVFTGEYDPPGKNVFYPINNIIISALDL